MVDTTVVGAAPQWLTTWTTAYPRPTGTWALSRPGAFGRLDPETGAAAVVDPVRDRRLPALARIVPWGELVSYRVGRRAVVAMSEGFVKVVRPSRMARLVAVHQSLVDAAGGALDLPVPTVVDAQGAVRLSLVGGCSLHRLLRHGAREAALVAAAETLVVLHGLRAPEILEADPGDSASRWTAIVARAEPAGATALTERAEAIDAAASALGPPAPARLVVVHGDCHDKNLFVDGRRRGLIDLDGARLGAREDDVANLAVHVALRSLQAGEPIGRALIRQEVVVDAYRRHAPLDAERMAVTQAAVWFRLACLYRFRAAGRPLVPTMLALSDAALDAAAAQHADTARRRGERAAEPGWPSGHALRNETGRRAGPEAQRTVA
ncbi:MAG: phosphotransferase [Acidimicrobiales bacterium]